MNARGPKPEFDAIVVGASLAGCATATLLARGGASVLLIDRITDPDTYKRTCGHFIQSGAVPALHRLGLYDRMLEAGAVRSRIRMWTPWGTVEPVSEEFVEPNLNLRRMYMDPLVRELAREQGGIDMRLGRTLTRVDVDDPERVAVEFTSGAGELFSATARLLVAADGRSSKIAELLGVKTRTRKNARFNYAAYFNGPPPPGAPDTTGWFLDPQWAGAFPTQGGLTGYYIMPTHDRLPDFKADLEGAIRAQIAELPGAPNPDELTLVGDIVGKIDLPNISRDPVNGNVALVGDAALTSDPLFGVGCGWAFESADWLAEFAGPALASGESLAPALAAYRAKHRRRLRIHQFTVNMYSQGRKFDPGQRMVFRAAARDRRFAVDFQRFSTRSAGVSPMLRPGNAARIVAAQFRRAQ